MGSPSDLLNILTSRALNKIIVMKNIAIVNERKKKYEKY